MDDTPRDLLSYLWSPLCAIGSHGPHGPNAQICVSVFGASIVPDRPRITVTLWRSNFSAELVEAAGTLSLTMLSLDQVGLLEPLGLQSGRAGAKLGGLEFTLDANGNPLFPGGVGECSCEVISATSFGDAVSFLCAVTERRSFAREPLTLQTARGLVTPEVMEKWNAHNVMERALSRDAMAWLPAAP